MRRYKIHVNGNPYDVKIKGMTDNTAKVECNGIEYDLELIEMRKEQKTPKIIRKRSNPYEPEKILDRTHKPGSKVGANFIKAPIPGLITQLLVKAGDKVISGQIVAKMEAMKMENDILASRDAEIKSIDVKIGDSVLENDLIMTLEE